MSHQENVNSNSYWDHRFSTDWESNKGREQSRFFARVAIEAMPQWLVHTVRWNNLTVCDWGCAQGDGTETLAQMLSWNITGIDFSGCAIEQAKQQYSAINFSHENLLDAPNRPAFDVIFSSNTLEHFSTPWDVFNKIANYASKFIVLLLPYREFDRHREHEVTFDAVNIPVSPNADWTLVHSSVTDTRLKDPSYWPGDQILLVYARTKQLAAQRFTLADTALYAGTSSADVMSIRQQLAQAEMHHAEALEAVHRDYCLAKSNLVSMEAHLAAEQSRADKVMTEVAAADARASAAETKAEAATAMLQVELNTERSKIQQLIEENATLVAAVHQSSELIHFLEYRVQALANEVSTLLATKSWRITAPLRAVRATPNWIKGRIRDVRYAYIHGGIRSVAYRSLTYIPKHLKLNRGIAYVPAPMALNYENLSFPGKDVISVQPRREKCGLADVFVFSIIDWHFRIQRPQHIAREFARAGHRVYFFSNHFEDSKEPGFSVERLDDTLPLYQVKLKVHRAPAIYFAAPTPEAITQILAGIRLFYNWSGTDRSWSLVQHGYWYPIAARVQSECLTYDCMDHHEGFGNVPQELLELEEQIMRRADLLVATSSWLDEHARKYNKHVEVIRNAGQYTDFCDAPMERFVDPQGRTIIGYYGAIAEWFDEELVAHIAQSFPDALILLIGADTAGVGNRLSQFPNVEMTGEVPYARLPYYLYAFDICMLPFKVIPLTLATNPVKVYEYLGAGRSVVSVDLPEMVQFGELVRLADTYEGFIEKLREAITALPDEPEVVARRKMFAAGQTWGHRVRDFREAIESLPRPKVSVIVLTYNNLALTQDCINSVEAHSDDVDLEIVIVDNASSDGSPEYLSSWAASRSNVKLILNSDNRGFAAGNNQGLAAASGDYLVILNNDTIVTRGWARRMVNHLRNTPEIGILGPITNNIGNEARVETRYTDLIDMPLEAKEITERSLGKWFRLRTVAFFCVMLPRSTYERCGSMTEDYGVGFFEDDDYCRRVEEAGLIVGCAEDVFIHHYLSATFNKLGDETKRALFETNRVIYESKWGAWIPHQYRNRADAEISN